MNQRANGEGSIYRRADGRWTAACYVLRPDGSRVRRAVYGKTRKDVADRLAVLITKTKAGLPLAVESWTLERFAGHWLKDVVGPRLRPSTLSSYRETLRLHVLPTLGRTNLRALTPTHVRTLLANKVADGLGARSIQIVHSTLRTMLSEAIREELIERNVATVVRPPSVERVEVQPWSTEEASRFLAAAADHRLHALFAVGVALGLRKGELLALRWDDVDLESGVLHVRQNVQRLPEMGLVFGPPKSRRTIPLPAASAKVLRTHRASQAAEALSLGPAWVDSGLVFTSTVGTVIEPRNLNRLFDELIAKARVRRIRFHDLRHTCASLLLAQNVPARVVMEILGHSQLAMTTDLYSHVMPTALREAADAMDRVFVQPN
jgi:integrase